MSRRKIEWLHKKQRKHNYENENYCPQSVICKDQVVSYCTDFLRDRDLYLLDYYPSGSMDYAGMRNHNRIVHFALSAILHTQEPEENLNILLLFQLFSNSNQLFVPFFTELTD